MPYLPGLLRIGFSLVIYNGACATDETLCKIYTPRILFLIQCVDRY